MPLANVLLDDRRVLSLERCQFDETYAGLLIGAPSGTINGLIQKQHRDQVKSFAEYYEAGPPVHHILPEITVVTSGTGRECPQLPRVSCIGLFHSTPVDPAKGDGSWAVISWFQDRMGPPTFTSLPWADFAADTSGY